MICKRENGDNRYIEFIDIFCLFIISMSFAFPVRMPYIKSIYIFDILIFLYVSITLFISGNPVKLVTKKIIYLSIATISPSLFLITYSNSINLSLIFISQYLFTAVFLFLFLDRIFVRKKFNIFLRFTIFNMSVVFLVYLFDVKIFGSYKIFSQDWGGRFYLTDFTPNDVGHYFLFFMFCCDWIWSKRPGIRYLFYIISIITFIFTKSKTVYLQIVIFFLSKVRKVYVAISGFVIFLSIVFFIPFSELTFFTRDFSADKSSNSIRLDMINNAVDYVYKSIFHPAYYSKVNVDGAHHIAVSSHNIIASYIVNFGFISFTILILLSILFLFVYRKNYYIKYLKYIIFIDIFTLMLNPMLSARVLWFPLSTYIYIIILSNSEGRYLESDNAY